MSISAGFERYYTIFGLRGVAAIASHRLTRRPRTLKISNDRCKHPIHVRVRTSDLSLYNTILLEEEYDLRIPDFAPKVIIDAGANCGMASIYYANKFPEATVFAIEPDPENFEMLLKNTCMYANVIAIEAALWNENGGVSLTGGEGFEKWGVQTVKGSGVRAITLDWLINFYHLDTIDLLKVDIEGAEVEVFSRAPWMQKVKVLCVELHDRFKAGCRESVTQAAGWGFRTWERGELTFFSRI